MEKIKIMTNKGVMTVEGEVYKHYGITRSLINQERYTITILSGPHKGECIPLLLKSKNKCKKVIDIIYEEIGEIPRELNRDNIRAIVQNMIEDLL